MIVGNQAIAVIDFSQASSPLEPAWPSTHRALMPIAGKPLIVHLIEMLLTIGVKHIRVAGSIQQYAVSKRLGDGKEWGVKIRYSDLHGQDLLLQSLMEQNHCLYFMGDHIHSMNAEEFLPMGAPTLCEPKSQNDSAAYWMIIAGRMAKFSMDSMTKGRYRSSKLITTKAYHRANMMAISGQLDGITISGKKMEDNLYIDWDTSIAKGAQVGECVSIGKHCRIGKRVVLDSNCSIGNGTILSHDTHLRNVTVLPNSFIGQGTQLRDAIVTPIGLFDLEGQFWPIADQHTIGRTRANDEHSTGLPTHHLSSIEKKLRTIEKITPTLKSLGVFKSRSNDKSIVSSQALSSKSSTNQSGSYLFRRSK